MLGFLSVKLQGYSVQTAITMERHTDSFWNIKRRIFKEHVLSKKSMVNHFLKVRALWFTALFSIHYLRSIYKHVIVISLIIIY